MYVKRQGKSHHKHTMSHTEDISECLAKPLAAHNMYIRTTAMIDTRTCFIYTYTTNVRCINMEFIT